MLKKKKKLIFPGPNSLKKSLWLNYESFPPESEGSSYEAPVTGCLPRQIWRLGSQISGPAWQFLDENIAVGEDEAYGGALCSASLNFQAQKVIRFCTLCWDVLQGESVWAGDTAPVSERICYHPLKDCRHLSSESHSWEDKTLDLRHFSCILFSSKIKKNSPQWDVVFTSISIPWSLLQRWDIFLVTSQMSLLMYVINWYINVFYI